MDKSIVNTAAAPKAIGPYSQGISVVGKEAFYFSGQIAIDPSTGKLIEGNAQEQTARIFQNIDALLASCGMTTENVVKTTVFLTDISDFTDVNAEYAKHFQSAPPARSCVQVAALPAGAKVEIEIIAFK